MNTFLPFKANQARSLFKLLHWTMVPLFAWFVIVQPADVARFGPVAVRFHGIMGLAFVSTALFWTVMYLAGQARTKAWWLVTARAPGVAQDIDLGNVRRCCDRSADWFDVNGAAVGGRHSSYRGPTEFAPGK